MSALPLMERTRSLWARLFGDIENLDQQPLCIKVEPKGEEVFAMAFGYNDWAALVIP
jgi:hypothetical protein